MLEKFLQYLSVEKRFSEHTRKAYETDIVQFYEFAGITDGKDIKEVDSLLVRGWIIDLFEQDVKSTTINRKLSSLRTFFKWLLKEGIISKSPLQIVKGPKNEKRLPSFAKTSDLEKEHINNYYSDDFNGRRDRLIVELLYQTGIRLSELINLKETDIGTRSIKVLGKRNKERIIPISSELNEQIQDYLFEANKITNKAPELFVLINGKKLYPKFVYRRINSYLGVTTNLEKKSPHVLRHTFATHMLNNGAGLEVLKELLGHASLSATQVYTHNSFKEITKIYSQSHPRGAKN